MVHGKKLKNVQNDFCEGVSNRRQRKFSTISLRCKKLYVCCFDCTVSPSESAVWHKCWSDEVSVTTDPVSICDRGNATLADKNFPEKKRKNNLDNNTLVTFSWSHFNLHVPHLRS